MSNKSKKLVDLQEKIDRLKEQEKEEKARIKREERQNRTKRLIDLGAFVEAVYGSNDIEELKKLILRLRLLGKSQGLIGEDELDRKRKNKETLSKTQLSQLEELFTLEQQVRNQEMKNFIKKDVNKYE